MKEDELLPCLKVDGLIVAETAKYVLDLNKEQTQGHLTSGPRVRENKVWKFDKKNEKNSDKRLFEIAFEKLSKKFTAENGVIRGR